MITRIVDTAHTLAVRHAEGDHSDLDAARRATLRGLEIDETSEVLYRDWTNVEWGARNTSGIRKAIARLQQVARAYKSRWNLSPNSPSTLSCPNLRGAAGTDPTWAIGDPASRGCFTLATDTLIGRLVVGTATARSRS
ncbi:MULTISPECIES: hypothetical protein [Streptomyces]|uniref:hypothetical protein n=1 Tax=Streptomyces TaxID=1883 RepID=UPI00117EE0AD|nr:MULTISPECIES: hypothetical protein [Streptomyces]